MHKHMTALLSLLLLGLFLGSMVMAEDSGGTANTATATADATVAPTAVRTALHPTLTANTGDDDGSADDSGAMMSDADIRMKKIAMTIKEHLGTQAAAGIPDDKLNELYMYLMHLGVSPEKLKSFTPDQIDAFLNEVKTRNPELVTKLENQKHMMEMEQSTETEHSKITSATDAKQRWQLFAQLFARLAKDEVKDAAAEARIKALLAKLTPTASAAVVADTKAKLEQEANAIRIKHLLVQGKDVLDHANTLLTKANDVYAKLQTASANVQNAKAKAVVDKLLTRLKALIDKLSAQITSAQAAYDAFSATNGATKENAMKLRQELAGLNGLSMHISNDFRAASHLIARATEIKSDDDAKVADVDSDATAVADTAMVSADVMEAQDAVATAPAADAMTASTTTDATATTTTGGGTA